MPSKPWKEKVVKEKPLNMGNLMGNVSGEHSLTGNMKEGLIKRKEAKEGLITRREVSEGLLTKKDRDEGLM